MFYCNFLLLKLKTAYFNHYWSLEIEQWRHSEVLELAPLNYCYNYYYYYYYYYYCYYYHHHYCCCYYNFQYDYLLLFTHWWGAN